MATIRLPGLLGDKGMPDAQAKAYLKRYGTNVALFGTGAWPDSDHARDCIAQGEAW